MPKIENIINAFLKESSSQPLVSNPPYVGDQIEDKKIKKEARKIFVFETSQHFLDRMQERNISDAVIKEVISKGKPRFQNINEGLMEFVRAGIKVVIDMFDQKLVTVMIMEGKESSLDESISEIESVVADILNK